MLLFIQMRWNVEGRLPLEDVWKLELQEAQAVTDKQSSSRLVAMHKVAAQRRVIAIVDVERADDLDRDYMARLPLHEYLELEAV